MINPLAHSQINVVVSTVMGIGFWIFFTNVFITAKAIYRVR